MGFPEAKEELARWAGDEGSNKQYHDVLFEDVNPFTQEIEIGLAAVYQVFGTINGMKKRSEELRFTVDFDLPKKTIKRLKRRDRGKIW